MPTSRALLFAALAALPALAGDADEQEYQRRWKSAANAVARQHRFAARWCAENGLEGAAWHEWNASLALEPDMEDARKAVGQTKKGGEWVADPDAKVERRNSAEAAAFDDALEVYRKKRASVEQAATRELAPLARWCEKQGYSARAKRIWGLMREYDPENTDACEAIGWEEAGGRWFPPREAEARRAAQKLLKGADEGKASQEKGEAAEKMNAKLERRRSPHFDFEARASQEDLAGYVRHAEAARTIFYELLPADEQKRVALVKGVFFTNQEDHRKFLEKVTPLNEDDRRTHETLGGWTRFEPSVLFELWTPGAAPDYHREAAFHVTCHMLLVGTWKIEQPPAWLQEGLSLWMSDRLTGSALVRCTDLRSNVLEDDRERSTAGWRARLRRMRREGTLPALKTVLKAKYDDLTLEKMMAAWSFIAFLADSCVEAFRDLIRRLGEGEPATDALMQALKVKDYAELQTLWEAWADGNL